LIGADLIGANLTGADLIDADLAHADLIGANLTGANLTGANLAGANLARASLTGANLTGAKYSETQTINSIIQGPTRFDGYQFLLYRLNDCDIVRAGCRSFTLAEYYEHVKTYYNDSKRYQTTLILDYFSTLTGFLDGLIE
jgi:uncharacterized protein YjbI with pentapeptide repeats